jgi:hypothetical protein
MDMLLAHQIWAVNQIGRRVDRHGPAHAAKNARPTPVPADLGHRVILRKGTQQERQRRSRIPALGVATGEAPNG